MAPLERGGTGGGDSASPLGCPTAEQLAVYAEGRSSPKQAAQIETHLVTCAECREVLVDAGSVSELPDEDSLAVRGESH